MMPIQKEILEVKSAPRAEFLLPGILSMLLTHLGGYHLTVLNDKFNMNFQNLMTLSQTVLPLDQ